MKKSLASLLVATAALIATVPAPALAEGEHVASVTEYVEATVKPWLSDAAVIEAIKAQNATNANLSQGDIDALDNKWRAEIEGNDKPMIDGVLGSALSKFLKGKQEEAGGLVTEVFVMDAKGLNVGQSDVTSDYWQGDEAKFQKSFGAGPDAIYVDEAEKDESTQMLQAQASVTIKDPQSGEAIGAITVGVNLDSL
ncbi:hypothetical protein SJ05684_c09200 [Sinorhizobium sojae CCBAU 05684]|uniref:Uncharacterized protein n=1 Tax=Sinorhizobium sojae CCBAU 05684 TaxID=716928 RepID=A0A249P9G7_9HYPH|nr:hypothetical protein [Sinorhizobium sojae]ASY62382.1 hypothetical protein SJ05684_c09200 [Sinorhizobium sojae CCBAU 05684]